MFRKPCLASPLLLMYEFLPHALLVLLICITRCSSTPNAHLRSSCIDNVMQGDEEICDLTAALPEQWQVFLCVYVFACLPRGCALYLLARLRFACESTATFFSDHAWTFCNFANQ